MVCQLKIKMVCDRHDDMQFPQWNITSASLTGYSHRATVLGFWLGFGVLGFQVLGVAVVGFFAVLGGTVHLGWIFMNHEIKHGFNLVVFVAVMTLHWNYHLYVSASWRMFSALASIAALVPRLVFDMDAVFANYTTKLKTFSCSHFWLLDLFDLLRVRMRLFYL